MSWRFLVDANLPVALARAMEGIGYPSAHVSDLGRVSDPDTELWQVAAARGDVIVGKDFDFVLLANAPNGSQRVICCAWETPANTFSSLA